jgi:hypothetical protein
MGSLYGFCAAEGALLHYGGAGPSGPPRDAGWVICPAWNRPRYLPTRRPARRAGVVSHLRPTQQCPCDRELVRYAQHAPLCRLDANAND